MARALGLAPIFRSATGNGISAQVRTLLAAGGGLTSQPFYTTTVC